MIKFVLNCKKKYNELSAPVKAALWFVICNIIQKGIALLATPIYTRILSTEEYGVYSVYQSWYSIVSIFITFNLSAGVYNNGMVKWPDDRKRYTSSSLGLSTTIWLFFAGIFLVFHNFWEKLFDLPYIMILAMFIDALMVAAFNYWASGERFDYKYKKVVAASVLVGVLGPLIGVPSVLICQNKSLARIYAVVLVNAVVGLFFYIKIMREGKTFFVKDYWKFAFNFNLPLLPYYLSQMILNQSDRIMIANYVGEDKAAIYSIAYNISMMFSLVTGAINNSFIPYTYKALKDKKYKNLRNNTSYLVIGVAGFCIIAILFGPELIRIFAAKEYYEARWAVPPIAEAVLFNFLYVIFCNVEFYYEETKFVMTASIIAAITNLGLNVIFIKWFGYMAAAYTTLFCYILMAVAHYIMYKIVCKKHCIQESVYDEKAILGISIISLGIMFGFVFIYDYFIIRYIFIFLMIVGVVMKRQKIITIYQELKGK